ncbi:MAG: S9 family peptidase, partial [Chitinophagaceae bacterium]|nr:S9 family peptidase [Chitinophagaceae bacterium]
MKKLILLSMISMAWQLNAQTFKYPQTKKDNTKDNYFGQEIKDPYRWLEDDNSAQTKAWVKEQNRFTENFLSKIPFRNQVKSELESMWNYEKYSTPIKEGRYYLYYKNNGLQNQSVLYIQEGLHGEATEFLNPNTLNENGTAALNTVSFSKNQKYCAYSVSNAGSDWQDIYVMDVASKQLISDAIHYSKFSGISWKGDDGFYYSGYDKPHNESEKY